ncbi:ribosomal RNA-processing protein 7-domain-containing protein [Schizophyllum amplum]|uniref:Ribosomal RNA-processing protein 7-domain-containing protein n=1 Tax=Schizophyllum amplum TaxID=97359 RepID=A0A550CRR8_9AGAR|nr:ribosomal RNA-processing protein 7-domain-containing protein [Auriculariopsis ampla]
MVSAPTHIAGFTVLPVAYTKSATHYIYARAHQPPKKQQDDALPAGRTLFLANVPPDATDREIITFFKPSGTVEKVVLDFDLTQEEEPVSSDSEDEEMSEGDEAAQEEADADERPRKRRRKDKKPQPPTVAPLPKPPLRKLGLSGRSAHVVFLDASSLERALSPPSSPRPWPTDPDAPTGLAHYTAQYDALRPPLDAVRAHADTYMDLYEFEQARARRKSKYRKGEAIVDEDGFTLVTRGGAYGQTLGGGVGVATKKFQQTGEARSNPGRKKKAPKDKAGFYAFEKAERQRKELIDLKRKWEEDKEKIEKLKASRKFRPY